MKTFRPGMPVGSLLCKKADSWHARVILRCLQIHKFIHDNLDLDNLVNAEECAVYTFLAYFSAVSFIFVLRLQDFEGTGRIQCEAVDEMSIKFQR